MNGVSPSSDNTVELLRRELTFPVAPQSENIKLNPGLCRLFQAMWNDFHNADGFICVSDPEIDGASIEVISSTLGVPLIGVG